jgi:hypothetical protein
MKKTIIKLILTAVFLVAAGNAPAQAAGPWPVPLCYPNPCSTK